MIIEFSAENFLSFKDKFYISFVGKSGIAENNELYFQENGQYLSKLMMVIGANASGKSNVLNALTAIMNFIAYSFSEQWRDNLDFPLRRHFSSSKNAVSKVELLFNLEKQTYRYQLEVNEERVLYEAIFIKNKSPFRYLFKRTWDKKSQVYHYVNKDFPFTGKMATQTRDDASIISTANQYKMPLANAIAIFFKECCINVNLKYTYPASISAAALFFHNQKLNQKMLTIMKKIDLGISAIEIKQDEAAQTDARKIEYTPVVIHQVKNKVLAMPLILESNGTQALFVLLGKILLALDKGRMVVIDELDRDLHPDMLEHVLNLFINSETNPHNAQLIFTSHIHEPLLFLDKNQVVLVEKDENLSSHAWHVSDIKGLRADENIYKRYKAGAYGAIPNLDESWQDTAKPPC